MVCLCRTDKSCYQRSCYPKTSGKGNPEQGVFLSLHPFAAGVYPAVWLSGRDVSGCGEVKQRNDGVAVLYCLRGERYFCCETGNGRIDNGAARMSLKTMVFQKRSNHAKELADFFFNKDILITGGCGSIGSEIVKQLIAYSPKRIRVFDNNESGLFHLQEKLCSPLLRVLVGDIRDKERLRLAARGCDIIFHAAALKHVPLCEYNPFEAVHTNVIGTQNLVIRISL